MRSKKQKSFCHRRIKRRVTRKRQFNREFVRARQQASPRASRSKPQFQKQRTREDLCKCVRRHTRRRPIDRAEIEADAEATRNAKSTCDCGWPQNEAELEVETYDADIDNIRSGFRYVTHCESAKAQRRQCPSFDNRRSSLQAERSWRTDLDGSGGKPPGP